MNKIASTFAALFFVTSSALSACAVADEATHKKPHHPTMSATERVQTKPFDLDADAMADVNAAITRAAENDKKALVVMGANWCHDSLGLVARFEKPEFQTLIEDNYELIYVSSRPTPGADNLNAAVSSRFGVDEIEGTPTVFILDGDGNVLNADSTGYWRNAYSVPTDVSYAYFDMYAKK
jgi:thioredoxin-related protein